MKGFIQAVIVPAVLSGLIFFIFLIGIGGFQLMFESEKVINSVYREGGILSVGVIFILTPFYYRFWRRHGKPFLTFESFF